MTGEIARMVDEDIRQLSGWLGCEIVELNVRIDHIHVVVVIIPLKVLASSYRRTVKGKIAIKLSEAEEETVLGESFLEPAIFCEYDRDK